MITKLWQLKGIFLLLGLFVAFAACVKEKDPNWERDRIKTDLTQIVEAINARDLGALNAYFVKPNQEGKGPNALLAAIAMKNDSTFVMNQRKFSFNKKEAEVRFTFSEDTADSNYSYLYLHEDNGWKISGFEIK